MFELRQAPAQSSILVIIKPETVLIRQLTPLIEQRYLPGRGWTLDTDSTTGLCAILKFNLKYSHNTGGMRPELFYRDTHGNDVDLVIRLGRKLLQFEIKSDATFTEDYLKGLISFRKIIGTRSLAGCVLYNGEQNHEVGGTKIFNPLRRGGFGAIVG